MSTFCACAPQARTLHVGKNVISLLMPEFWNLIRNVRKLGNPRVCVHLIHSNSKIKILSNLRHPGDRDTLHSEILIDNLNDAASHSSSQIRLNKPFPSRILYQTIKSPKNFPAAIRGSIHPQSRSRSRYSLEYTKPPLAHKRRF